DRDEDAEDRRRCEAEVLDDLHVLASGELADDDRRAHEEQREEDEVVEDLVADRLAEDSDSHDARGLHRPPSPISATRRTNTSSSVSRTGLSETSVAPAATSSRSSSSGRPSAASSIT